MRRGATLSLAVGLALIPAGAAVGQAQPALSAPIRDAIAVTPDNFVRAETDLYFGAVVQKSGLGKFEHNREPLPIDKQTVIRTNRDTLYSGAVFNLDAGPATVTLPDAGTRFMSMQVITGDEDTPEVVYGAGSHTLTREQIGTRYVLAAVRILVDPADAQDVARVHALQDESGSARGHRAGSTSCDARSPSSTSAPTTSTASTSAAPPSAWCAASTRSATPSCSARSRQTEPTIRISTPGPARPREFSG
ncbi:MAG: DUF1254 domain-containing protein [Chloroflexi bacterium]|nr:DUF1254 domain-containing protein [Chloroflexota bacterium]